jgi:hypothetical protein
MFNKLDYEILADSLGTSEEILYAIEQLTGCEIRRNLDLNENIALNAAENLWFENDREQEILAALPTKNGGTSIPSGTEVFWGWEGKFAEFNGEEWVKA